MKPDRNLIVFIAIAFMASPLVTWGALVAVARVWKANLRPTLSWLRALRWVGWLIGAALTTVSVVYDPLHWLFPIGVTLNGSSSGLALCEGWVKRRYAPELLVSPDGYWPSPRN
jgi:hypothetical protein